MTKTLYIPFMPNYEKPIDPDYAGAIVTSIATTYVLTAIQIFI